MLLKYVEKIPFSSILNLTRITGTSFEDLYIYIYILLIISLSVFLRIGNISEESCRENQNTKFVFHNVLPQKSCI